MDKTFTYRDGETKKKLLAEHKAVGFTMIHDDYAWDDEGFFGTVTVTDTVKENPPKRKNVYMVQWKEASTIEEKVNILGKVLGLE